MRKVLSFVLSSLVVTTVNAQEVVPTESVSETAPPAAVQPTVEQPQTPTAQAPAVAPVTTPAPTAVVPPTAPAVPAEAATYKIKQIISVNSTVVAETNSTEVSPKGTIFVVTFDDGKQCPLILKDTTKNRLTLSSSECDRAKYITVTSPIQITDQKALTHSTTQMSVDGVIRPEVEGGRSISDLGYLTPYGHFSIDLGSQYTTQKATMVGNTETEMKGRLAVASLDLAYGLIEDLEFAVEASYLMNRSTEYEISAQESFSNGMRDPEFKLRYRMFSQTSQSPFDLVATAGYSPKSGVSKLASTEDNGNGYRGSDAKYFGLALYKRTPQVQYELGVLGSFYGVGESESSTTDEKYEDDDHNSVQIAGSAQFAVNPNFLLNIGLGVVSYSSSYSQAQSNGVVTKVSSYSSTILGGGARFVLIPQKAVLDLTLMFQGVSDITNTQGNASIKIKDQTATNAMASLKYEL